MHEPVIAKQRTVEHRDALIKWRERPLRRGPDGRPLKRWDGLSTKEHERTGKQVPDDSKQVEIHDYIGVERAEWPAADFIVGNPPFIGNKHMREAMGDAYVEAVRGTYREVPNTVDYVVYWWHRAAELARAGKVRRFGLITTNSLGQTQNRQVLTSHLEAQPALRLAAAIADHPWVDEGADVRISMTVAEADPAGAQRRARLGRVVDESQRSLSSRRSFEALPPHCHRLTQIKIHVSATIPTPGLTEP